MTPRIIRDVGKNEKKAFRIKKGLQCQFTDFQEFCQGKKT